MAQEVKSKSPYVSAYICAKDRSVKHQCMSELANATLPFSGLNRSSGSGSIPLREKCDKFSGNSHQKVQYST